MRNAAFVSIFLLFLKHLNIKVQIRLTKSPGNHGLSDMPVECITASPASDTPLIKFRVLGSVLTDL